SRNSAPDYRGSWGNFGVFTYIQLTDDYPYKDFQPKLDSIIAQHVTPIFENLGITIQYQLQPITDIHLHSKIQDEAEAGGDIATVYIFTAIAVLILIIACINYMNLATARSAKRAKEVGIRKVAGSDRSQLIGQFLTESILMTFFAAVISLVLIYIFLPFFNDMANKSIPFSILFRKDVLLSLMGIVMFTGIVGGSYPAFYLSSFKPISVLQGGATKKGGHAFLRKGLVVIQFFISISMLVSTLVVYKQLNFLSDKDLGFEKEHVVIIEMPNQEVRDKFQALKNELIQLPEVKLVATSSTSPGNNIGKVIFGVENNEGVMEDKGIDFYFADFDYINALGMNIAKGRDFNEDISGDTLYSVLVNEAMVARMNWEEPLGKKFSVPFFGRDTTVLKEVIGVIKDYHQNSLYDEIEPLMVMYNKNNMNMFLKIEGGEVKSTLSKIENIWQQIHPDNPFSFNFLEEEFAAQYDQDERRGKIFTVFTMFAIIIACLGLLGLSTFTTEQRNKEISIRKVNGAEISDIIILVSRDFLKLVMIGTVIALPVSW
ncbi:MAG: FtsX-like permease family protein, partial [Cyclobacteriaceae bacterium]|nr:FtsX-like permease family protein [Cyclobacteriaceae bacterium]